jgi:hypothetical protein
MKAYRGEEVQLLAFLTLTVDGDKCAASRTYRFTPGVVAPGIRRIGGWVGPTGCLEFLKKR